MIKKINISKKYISLGLFILILAIAFIISIKLINNWYFILINIKVFFMNFFKIIAPIFYGFILAYILYRPTVYIQSYLVLVYKKIIKKDISKGINTFFRIISIFLIFILIGLLIKLIINFIIPPIVDNIKILLNNLPTYEAKLNTWINELVMYLNENNIEISSSGEFSKLFAANISTLSNSALSLIANVVSSFSSFIVDFIFTLIFTFYFIKDKEALFRTFRKIRDTFLPNKASKIVTIFIHDLDEIVGKFFIGQIIATIVVGFISAILMLLIKHPFAILIGTVAGITNIIPLIGPVIGALFAFVLGVFTNLSLGIWGALLLILYQQVDGNFVQPKIVGDRIGLIPIWILIVVLIGGSYFGAIGMILSMPIAGLIRIYFNRYSEYKKRGVIK